MTHRPKLPGAIVLLVLMAMAVLCARAEGYTRTTGPALDRVGSHALTLYFAPEWDRAQWLDIYRPRCPERPSRRAAGCKYHFEMYDRRGGALLYSERGRVGIRGRWLRRTAHTLVPRKEQS